MRRPLTLLALACACALPADAAVAAPHGPGKGRVWHSGIGGYGPGAVGAFARQSGKHPAVYQAALLKSDFRLSSHSVSRAALRRKLRSRRFLSFAPEFARR